jgi:hypothetical protein
MSNKDTIVSFIPWTIKQVSVATRDAVNKAARQEGITAGQWLDKRVSEWLGDGSPVHVNGSAAANDTTPAEVLAMLANMGRAGIPVQKGVGVLANRLVKRTLTGVLGVPARKPPPARMLEAEPTIADDKRQVALL